MDSLCRFYYKRQTVCFAVGAIFSIVTVVIALSLISYSSSKLYTTDSSLKYAPSDTRIIPFSNALCQELTLSSNEGAIGTGAYKLTLEMLDSPPLLSGVETFSFTDRPYFSDHHNYNYLYLYRGSSVNVSTCYHKIRDNNELNFYLLRGRDNFQRFVHDNSKVYVGTYKVNESCNTGALTIHTYSIQDDGYYYFDFTATVISNSDLNFTLSFNRTYYQATSNTSNNCSLMSYNTQSCSVGVPVVGGTALLQVSPVPGAQVKWGVKVSLTVKCSTRIWMYTIIGVLVLVGSALLSLAVGALLYCLFSKKKGLKKKKYTPLTPPVSPPNCQSIDASLDTGSLKPNNASTNNSNYGGVYKQ